MKKLAPFLIATVGKCLMRLLLATCRFEIEGLDRFKAVAKDRPLALLLWHQDLALAPFFLARFAKEFTYTAFVSNSRDGQLIGRLVRSYTIGKTLLVPHHARHEALKQLIRILEKGETIPIVTPDGPKGPPLRLKPGIALAALKTNASFIPWSWRASSCWRLSTWDRLKIPKPFSTIHVDFGAPLQIDPSLRLEEAQQQLQEHLNVRNGGTFAEKS